MSRFTVQRKPLTKLTLTPTEAGELLDLGRNSTYDAIHRGQIRSIRMGKRILIPRTEIERILASGNGGAVGQPD